VNLVVVSDHGMAATGPGRVIWLDRFVARSAMDIDELSPVLMAWPAEGLEDSVYRALQRAPHLAAYRRHQLPARFHLSASTRVPPIVAIAEPGWTIAWRQGTAEGSIGRGNHGYNDSLPAMRGIFVARGPAFRRGVVVPAFRNIHLYPLLARLLGLEPATNDGSLDSTRAVLSDVRR
jgi:predicted AlkP superfamily pyrophosphatase or phosphodiesterase